MFTSLSISHSLFVCILYYYLRPSVRQSHHQGGVVIGTTIVALMQVLIFFSLLEFSNQYLVIMYGVALSFSLLLSHLPPFSPSLPLDVSAALSPLISQFLFFFSFSLSLSMAHTALNQLPTKSFIFTVTASACQLRFTPPHLCKSSNNHPSSPIAAAAPYL